MNVKKIEARSLESPSKGYCFIIALGRSGSTLTQNLLNSIPGYIIRGENHNLLYHSMKQVDVLRKTEIIKNRREFVQLPSENREPGIAEIIGTPMDPWYGIEKICVEDYARALLDSFCQHVLRLEGQVRVAGFKEIRYHTDSPFFPTYISLMREFFKNPRFIVQTRNPDSLAQLSFWRNHSRDKVFRTWEKFQEMTEALVRERNSFLIDYDEFYADTSGPERLFEFLEEPYDQDSAQLVLGTRLRH